MTIVPKFVAKFQPTLENFGQFFIIVYGQRLKNYAAIWSHGLGQMGWPNKSPFSRLSVYVEGNHVLKDARCFNYS